MKDNVLVTAGIPRLFLKFVLPSVISMVLVGIQGMVDGMFLGNYESSTAMASVNIASPYMQLILGCSFILCTGTLSYLGRTLGGRDAGKAKNVFKTAVIAIMVSSCLIMALGVGLHSTMAGFLGADEVLLAGTGRYILVLALSAPAISLMVFFGFMERLVEKPHIYLAATVCCLVCNIFLNYIFIQRLHFGVSGAALATGLSYLIGLFIVAPPFLTGKTVVNIREGHFCRKILKEIVFNGSSEGVNYLAAALILFLFNHTFMRCAGEDGVAAFTVINYIGNFTTTVMFGISDGIGSAISCNFGAGRTDRVQKTLYAAIIINFMLGIFAFVLLHLCSRHLVNSFVSGNPGVVEMAVHGAEIYSFGFLFNGYNIIQSGYHTSLGNAVISAGIAAGRGIIFIIIGIAALPSVLGVNGVWLTVPFAEIMTAACCFIIDYRKKDRNLSKLL